jgi:sulfate adenylyltransferase large subunit
LTADALAAATARPRDLVRIATAGSVDDGKSTLIGRLLHDSRAIADDQLAALERATRRRGADGLDLALLTDGLRAEREQGITIDVAYRYFATPRRRFILADTPGHLQYTRNMVTGASTADVAIVLVDARNGVVEQTRRHVAIAALLRVPRLVVAVNKMDLVGFDEGRFAEIATDVGAIARRLGVADTTAIPTSALRGDNVVERSASTPWYGGPALLEHLEIAAPAPGVALGGLRFPVQWVIRRPPDYRAYAGRVEGGTVRPGDAVVALPDQVETRVRAIDAFEGPLADARAPRSVALRLVDELDLGRGAMLADPLRPPMVGRTVGARVCWLDRAPLTVPRRFLLGLPARTVRAVVTDLVSRLDLEEFRENGNPGALSMNDVGRVRLATAEPIAADPYATNRSTGSAILIDEATGATVGALLIETVAP